MLSDVSHFYRNFCVSMFLGEYTRLLRLPKRVSSLRESSLSHCIFKS